MGLQPPRAYGSSSPHVRSGPPFSLGVEEELFLVDPVTGADQRVDGRPGAPRPGRRQVERSCTPARSSSSPASARAPARRSRARGLRRAVIATGAGLLGSGTHPSAAEGDAEITDKERYERIHDLLGDAAATPVGGLHIHVGMPDAETAIRAFNGLRRQLPLLQALAANSPFRHGRDTGLASAREVTMSGWPRSGVPRAMRDFEDFCAISSLLSRAADVPDYTWFWWKLRPHPRLGTVEIRALDAQASLKDTASLVALVHCLARDAASAGPAVDPPAEVLEEGIVPRRALGRRAASCPMPTAACARCPSCSRRRSRRPRPMPRTRLRRGARRAPALLGRGGGAGLQRAAHEIGGMHAMLRELTELTAAGTAAPRERA